MTPPAPVLAALALSGFALLACLGMLALTLQREIDVEVCSCHIYFCSNGSPAWKPAGGGGEGWRPGGGARLPDRGRGFSPLIFLKGAGAFERLCNLVGGAGVVGEL